MTQRVQTLRSSVAGVRPTGRQPGELYVNWPDRQLGVVDASSTAQDLVAVRFFSSLATYSAGDYVVASGQLYQALGAIVPGAFNPAQWAAVGAGGGSGGIPDAPSDSASYGRLNATWTKVLALAGGTLTGALSGVAATFSGALSVAGPATFGLIDLVRSTFPWQNDASVLGAANIDWSLGEVHRLTILGNATINVVNWPAAGRFAKVVLDISNTGAFAVTGWPSGTKWPGGAVPGITSGAGKHDMLMLSTYDGGATVFGNIIGQDYR